MYKRLSIRLRHQRYQRACRLSRNRLAGLSLSQTWACSSSRTATSLRGATRWKPRLHGRGRASRRATGGCVAPSTQAHTHIRQYMRYAQMRGSLPYPCINRPLHPILDSAAAAIDTGEREMLRFGRCSVKDNFYRELQSADDI